jgi:hypothetical protein
VTGIVLLFFFSIIFLFWRKAGSGIHMAVYLCVCMPPLAAFEYLLETNNPKEGGWGSPRDPIHEVRRSDVVETERRSIETNLTLRCYSRGQAFLENNKWRHAWRLLGTNSLNDGHCTNLANLVRRTSKLEVHAERMMLTEELKYIMTFYRSYEDRLCGLVVRVLGYRSGGPGSIPGTTRKKVVGLGRGPFSLVSTTEELLDRKVRLLSIKQRIRL